MLPVDRDAVITALEALQSPIDTLRQELAAIAPETADAVAADWQRRQQALLAELDRTQLRIAIIGAPRTGKSTLQEHLVPAIAPPAKLAVTEVVLTADTPHATVMAALLQEQDAVVYLVTEDLTDSALMDVKTLASGGQRVVVAFNKYDTYLPADRAMVLEHIQKHLQSLPDQVPSVAIATAPKPFKVRTYDAEGGMTERLEHPAPDVAPMTELLSIGWTEEVPHLVTQTVMRQTAQLRVALQAALNQVRRQQAQPVIEQLQWTAAAAAFASPVPSLDVLAAIAINGQLVMDLGRIYQQPLAWEQAQTIATELGTILVKLGIVEVSTQLLTAALKSHAATYLVGGGVQAFSAAYLTQLCGESLITCFEERALTGQTETAWSVDAIGQRFPALLPTMQRTEFLQALIRQGIQKLVPPSDATVALPASPGVLLETAPSTVTVMATTVPVHGTPAETLPSA
jgi:uncharacterized protein (DUF697 family)